MNQEPRFVQDYNQRQVGAAHRVLIDIGQILASFRESVVVIGGWVPELLLPNSVPEHVGSFDIDLALDAAKLTDGRYAELLQSLLETRRYRLGDKAFRLITDIDLGDGTPPIQVDVEFLAPKDIKLKGHKLIEGFRVFQFDACTVAFTEPREIELAGIAPSGSQNTVRWQVAALPDFLVLKAFALGGRDKPKDAYDLCYCLEHYPGGTKELAQSLKLRLQGEHAPLIHEALSILREKFASPEHHGCYQYADFPDLGDPDEHAIHRRRAFQLITSLLEEFDSS